jgi:hypothetical protein
MLAKVVKQQCAGRPTTGGTVLTSGKTAVAETMGTSWMWNVQQKRQQYSAGTPATAAVAHNKNIRNSSADNRDIPDSTAEGRPPNSRMPEIVAASISTSISGDVNSTVQTPTTHESSEQQNICEEDTKKE